MQNLFAYAIPEDILFLSHIFSSNNYELRLVGGSVRDSLRERKVSDFDLATSASPNQVQQILKNQSNCILIPTGLAHGTLTLVFNNNHYEITSYRIDGIYSDNRRPDSVHFTSSLEEDLSRRDFTINAIAVDPKTKEILDPFHGQEDIKQKLIKTVGDPKQRFGEDALRMLRACRFAAKLEYTIDSDTYLAIKELASNIQQISQERIRDEILNILTSDKPSVGFDLLYDLGLLSFILPELAEGYGIEQNAFHKFDVYRHNVETCNHMPKEDIEGRLAALLHDIGKPRAKKFALKTGNGNVFYNHEIIGAKMTKGLMKRLKFSNEAIHKTSLLVELHMFYYTKEWNDGAIRRFLKRFDGDINFLNLLFQLRHADRLGSGTKKNNPYILNEFQNRINNILAQDAALKISDLNINGNDLIESFSLSPGPIIGQILNHLLELVLDDPSINDYKKLVQESSLYIANIKKLNSPTS